MIKIEVEKELLGSLGKMNLHVNLAIEAQSFVALSGQSGSGKTTLLRILAGLEEAKGRIVVEDEVWLDGFKALPPQKRGIGFVFQDYALFPHKNIFENVAFGLRMTHLPETEVKKRVAAALELVGLQDFAPRLLG